LMNVILPSVDLLSGILSNSVAKFSIKSNICELG
jgi:hypothetical protein